MTTTDLAVRASDVPGELASQLRLADALARSDLLPATLRGKPANVLLVLQGARALNVPGFWALQSMHVIDGKLSMAAELMRALVIRAGHRVRVVDRTNQRAQVEIQRCDRDTPYVATFTADDAKAADLLGKANWRRYPAAMLVARATAIAVRDECPDVLFGVAYSPDELGAVTDEDGAPILEGEVLPDPPATPPTDRGPVDRSEALRLLQARADESGLTPVQRRNRLWAAFGKEHLHQCTDAELREAWRVFGPPDTSPANSTDAAQLADDAARQELADAST